MKQRNIWARTALVVVVLGALLGLTLPQAAVGHVGGTVDHLWVDHIRPRTDARYYTKAQSNSRFVNTNEQAADALHADEADDSNLLDGFDSTDLGIVMLSSATFTDECDAPATYNECAGVSFSVPEGESMQVSFWGSGTAATGSDILAEMCPAIRDVDTVEPLECFSNVTRVTLSANTYTAFSTMGEITIGEGTWVISLGFNPAAQVNFDDFGRLETKVLVKDEAAPTPIEIDPVATAGSIAHR